MALGYADSGYAGLPVAHTLFDNSYLAAFGRPVDAGAAANIVAGLGSGTLTQASFRSQLAPDPYAQALDGQLFSDLLNRPIDAVSLSRIIGEISTISGQTLASERMALATGPEAAADLTTIYSNDGQTISDAQRSTYVAELGAGAITMAQVEKDVADTGYTLKLVNQMFSSVQGYSATAAEIGQSIPALETGSSLAALRVVAAMSPTTFAALDGVYHNLLGASIDLGSAGYWQPYLAQLGNSLSGIRTIIAGSDAETSALNYLYRSVYGVNVDPGSQAYWVGQLANGNIALTGIRTALAYSNNAVGALNYVFQPVLGQDVDPGSQAYWQGQLAAGGSLADVRYGMAEGSYSAGAISFAYNSIFGTQPAANAIVAEQQRLSLSGSLAEYRGTLVTSVQAGADLRNLSLAYDGGGSDIATAAANILNSGGTAANIIAGLVAQPSILGGISDDYQQTLGRDPSSFEIRAAQQALGSGAESNVGLDQISAALLKGIMSFAAMQNPIGDALAATPRDLAAKQATTVADLRQKLSDPKVMAFLKTIQHFEGARFNSLYNDVPYGTRTFNSYD